jgi:hypothetical protein
MQCNSNKKQINGSLLQITKAGNLYFIIPLVITIIKHNKHGFVAAIFKVSL